MRTKRLILLILYVIWPAIGFGETVRFAVITDTQGRPIDEAVLSQAVQQVLDLTPKVQFVVATGDLAVGSHFDPATASQLLLWKKIVRPWYESDFQGLKVYPVPGNHDQSNCMLYRQVWMNVFPELPDNGPPGETKMTYSFEFGPCHLTMVNTSAPTPEGKHAVNLDWLARDLAETAKPIKLVFGHEPAYPIIRHLGDSLDARPELRDQFWSLLTEYGACAYFCGHLHIYDHWIKDNVHQIIVGTTGADDGPHNFLVVEADETDVTVQVYRIEPPERLEEFRLSDTASVAREERPAPEPAPESVPPLPFPCSCYLVVLIGLFRVHEYWLTMVPAGKENF